MTAVNFNRAIRGPVTAVPVVAGKGVRIVPDVENNRFVVEADETVLFEETNYTYGTTSVTLSEPYTNFEILEIHNSKGDVQRFLTSNVHNEAFPTLEHVSKNWLWVIPWSFTNSTTLTGATGRLYELGTTTKYDVASNAQYQRWIQPVKIIGIHRIANN